MSDPKQSEATIQKTQYETIAIEPVQESTPLSTTIVGRTKSKPAAADLNKLIKTFLESTLFQVQAQDTFSVSPGLGQQHRVSNTLLDHHFPLSSDGQREWRITHSPEMSDLTKFGSTPPQYHKARSCVVVSACKIF